MASVKKARSKQEATSQTPSPERYDKRVQLAIPLRVVTLDAHKRPHLDMACTLDVSLRGARLYGVRSSARVGEVVTVERGRNKFACRVVWIGAPDTPQKGQIGVEALESSKSLWDKDMREAADQFGPITIDPAQRVPEGERKRRFPRVKADVQARLLPHGGDGDDTFRHGRVTNICETGCLLIGSMGLDIGAHVQVILDLPNTDVAIRGRVKHAGPDGFGIEFREIRKSDRQLLRYWLQQQQPSVPVAALAGGSS
jgi:PilZ domain